MKEKILYKNTLGEGGRQPGEFYAVHSIATDSKGNLFTTETYHGQRVQKFVYKGLAPITKQDQVLFGQKQPKVLCKQAFRRALAAPTFRSVGGVTFGKFRVP